jgi:SOS-response transcriptional repressor LexA
MSPANEPLAKIRDRLHLTQGEFASKLGISRQHLSKLENASNPLSKKVARRVAEVCGNIESNTLIRTIPVRSWAQAGNGARFDSDELPMDWQKQIPTDCPDEQAFAVEIQGDSMEPKFLQGDIAMLMPTLQPRNGSLVVARLEHEGIVFKVFTARTQASMKVCCFTSYNPVFQPIEVSENNVIWNFPVYQIVRQVWR